MKPQTILIPFSFFILASALIPLAAAQESNILTDTLGGVWETLQGVGTQVTDYVGEHQAETAAIGGVGGVAAIAGVGWKTASSAKSKLEAGINTLTEKLGGVESSASTAAQNYQTQISELQDKLANVPAQLDPSEAINKIKVEAESKQLQTQGMLNSALNQVKEKEQRIHDLEVEVKTWKQIKAVP